jgi:two-component system nitrate/nitrite sensor histidine kinase NarX
MYNIFVRQPGISGREDIRELLETISHHLGMAVAKQRSDAEARQLSIIQERSALAHELHDSLAQTLVSLRFQVRLLQDLISRDDNQAIRNDVLKIRNGIDEAHTELRQLLNSFRAPVEQRGLIKGLDELVQHFTRETGVHTLFQELCKVHDLSPSEEMQMLRIAQECLANIRKHANAHTVRIMLSCRRDGTYVLLVEDDGVGFDAEAKAGRAGEHIGLSIMEERALRLGGHLRIESEPGEGTRVELDYRPADKPVADVKHWII